MLKRTSIKHINSILKKNPDWKILDIGCGYRANENANVVADVQDFSELYKNKKFVRINNKILPFQNNEFDFVIASHVIEHVEDFEFFIKELERISSKGYIELPTRLEDNLVFENKIDHIWWFCFDDISNQLLASKRNQLLNPFITVSMIKLLETAFRESLVIELSWDKNIEYKIDNKIMNEDFKKISFFKIIKKFFSKNMRTLLRK